MTYRIQVVDGRRITSYKIEASSPEEAKQRYMHYLSLLGAVVCEEVRAIEDLTWEDKPDDPSKATA